MSTCGLDMQCAPTQNMVHANILLAQYWVTISSLYTLHPYLFFMSSVTRGDSKAKKNYLQQALQKFNWAQICPWLRSPGIDSASLCSLAGRCVKYGCRTGRQAGNRFLGSLKRFTNSGSDRKSSLPTDQLHFVYEYLFRQKVLSNMSAYGRGQNRQYVVLKEE